MRLSMLVVASSLVTALLADPAPRVAVWDPQVDTAETRFRIDRPLHDQAAQWLAEGGCRVTRLTAAQAADPAVLRADAFDAYVSAGDAVPRAAIGNLLAFADAGGVLVALDARVPFLVAIEPGPDGRWTMAPRAPIFAWQTEAILNAVGGRYVYSPGLHDTGMRHRATPLLKRYLPDAPDIPNARLKSNFIPPSDGGFCYPLLRSLRYDGLDTTPQVWITRKGRRTAIISSNARYVSTSETNLWPVGRATINALARMAKDLHDGTLALAPEMEITFDEKMPPPPPLTGRFVRGNGVDPEGARVLARWGRFDGSCIELGPSLAAGRPRVLEAGCAADQVPRALEPGASLTLVGPVAPPAVPCFLRVRGAYVQSGAVLQVAQGSRVLWSEVLNSADAGGAGNTAAADLRDRPAEFVRIIFVPESTRSAPLTVSNPGRRPLTFDALQLETPGAARAMHVALNAGYLAEALGKDHVPRDLTRKWAGLRVSSRTQWVGPPGATGRWDRCEALLDAALAVNPHLELIWEGTAAWDAISPERYADGVKARRPHCVPPDPSKYAEIVEHLTARYGDRIEMVELWNEANGQQFWRGSYQEYADFCKMAIPIVRRLAPKAQIISAGTAGWSDDFFDVLLRNDLMKEIDLVPNHVYAGKSAGWDIAYGLGQGGMYAAGVEKEIYCNEQGFVWKNNEWFTSPPVFTPHLQMLMLNKALARLMANDLAKVSLFNAGGDTQAFGLIGPDGVPRPAYAVVDDYLALNGGRRWHVAMASPDGHALQGVYETASLHPDGSVTVVLNPAEVDRLQAPPAIENPSTDFDKGVGLWTGFQGKVTVSNGVAQLVPASGQAYMGFGRPVGFDLARWPVVEVSVPACAGLWSMNVRENGREIPLFRDQPAGTHRIDLREVMDADEPAVEGELTIRVTGSTALASVHFLPPEAANGVMIKPVRANLLELNVGKPFYGRAVSSRGSVSLKPDEGKPYVGFDLSFPLDPARTPIIEIEAADCINPWAMTLKLDNRQVPVFSNQLSGTARADLRSLISDLSRRTVTATVRAQGPMTLKTLRLLPDPSAPVRVASAVLPQAAARQDRSPLPVKVLIPLQHAARTARATAGGCAIPVDMVTHPDGDAPWAEVTLALPGRTVLNVAP